jgi:hypothetical protein
LQAKAGNRTKAGKVAKALVEDDRFGRLFDNPDFEIDEEAEDFKLRNPSGIAAKRVRNDRDMDSDQEDGSDADYDGEIGKGGSGFNQMRKVTRGGTMEVMMIMTASICRRVTVMMMVSWAER